MHNTNKLESILSPKRDYTPKSSVESIENFLKSTIYGDFLEELKLRIEDMRDYYEDCPEEKYIETKGGLKALRLVSGIFTDLHNNALEALNNIDPEIEK